MLCDECGAKLRQTRAQLWEYFGADQLFDRLFALVVRVDIYLKLQ